MKTLKLKEINTDSPRTDDELDLKSKGKKERANSVNLKTVTSTKNQTSNINVICRFRPLNEKEKAITKELCVEFLTDKNLVIKSASENNIYNFGFDRVLDPTSTQMEMYEASAKPIVESLFQGFNGTIFAYGQTSSGKTHTMQGVIEDEKLKGITPRIISNIFEYISQSNTKIEFNVCISMIEIYLEKIKDLLEPSKSNLNVREDKSKGIYIEDLTECQVTNEEEIMAEMRKGMANRSIASTNMNENSSRSHSIVILNVKQTNLIDLTTKNARLYLVDLAGSEKISKTGVSGSTLEEAKMINKSLTCLGMVINCLTDGKSAYIPYRDSKLTRILQDSLGGNARTCLIIACSPSNFNEAETLSTLRFGLRAKRIKNKPKVNKESSTADLKNDIIRLEKELDVAKQRVILLENYIELNKLIIPKDNEEFNLYRLNLAEDTNAVESQGKINISINTTNNYINNTNLIAKVIDVKDIVEPNLPVNTVCHMKKSSKEDESNLSINNVSIRDIRDLEVMTSQLKYERDIQIYLKGNLNQIKAKNIELTEKLMNLEEQYKKLSFMYEGTCKKINDMNIIIENKEKYIDDLKINKINSDNIIEKYEIQAKEFEEKNSFFDPNIKNKMVQRTKMLSGPELELERISFIETENKNKRSLGITDYNKLKEEYMISSDKKKLIIDTHDDNLLLCQNINEISFSNKNKDKDLNTIIEENSNLNFSKTINNYNSAKYNEVSKSILFDKEEIMKQIEEQSELKLKTFNKFRQYKDLATNFIFSNWNITNFKTKFKNAYNTDK